MVFSDVSIVFFLFVLTPIVCGMLFAGHYFFKKLRRDSLSNNEIYECGNLAVNSHKGFSNNHYYKTALIFLLFEIEVLLLLPILGIFFKPYSIDLKSIVYFEVILFVLILGLGLVYLIKKKVLYPYYQPSFKIKNTIPAIYKTLNKEKFKSIPFGEIASPESDNI